MKSKKIKTLMLGTLIAFLILGFLPYQTNAQTPVKADNVTKVVVGNANNQVEGVLVKVGPKKWIHYYPDEKRIWTTHTETRRDEWSVYLDSPKYKSSTINLLKKNATFVIGDKTHVRPILSSSNDPIGNTTSAAKTPVNGKNVTEVTVEKADYSYLLPQTFSSKFTLKQTKENQWVLNDDRGSHVSTCQESKRTDTQVDLGCQMEIKGKFGLTFVYFNTSKKTVYVSANNNRDYGEIGKIVTLSNTPIPASTTPKHVVKGAGVTWVKVGRGSAADTILMNDGGGKVWNLKRLDNNQVLATYTETRRGEWGVYLAGPKHSDVVLNLWQKTLVMKNGDKVEYSGKIFDAGETKFSSGDTTSSDTPATTITRSASTNSLGPAPLSNTDMAQVMKWIAVKVAAIRVPYCYRKSETRGAGVPLSGNCEEGLEDTSGLCYQKCKPGYSSYKPEPTNCVKDCPAGLTDIGLFCQKPANTYGRGVGLIKSECEKKYGNCEEVSGLWYQRCKPGYKYTTGNICALVDKGCPSGFADTGTGCAKPKYDRGIGVPYGCSPGKIEGRDTERSGLLCYPTCKNKDYEGVGPVCWQQCPSQQPVGCGFGCSVDELTCASVVSDQVLSPILAVVSLVTLGSGAAAAKAADAAGDAAKIADAAGDAAKATAKTANQASKAGKAANKLKDILASAKKVRNAAFGGKENFKVVNKLVKIGSNVYAAQDTILDQVDLFASEFSRDFANQTSPEIAQEIDRRFGPKGAEYIKREWAKRHLVMMLEADAWATAQNVVSLASIADPTGISGVVSAYLHPICKDNAVFPNIRVLSAD